MRKRWLVGTLVVLSVPALTGRVVTLAQKPERMPIGPSEQPSSKSPPSPNGWRSAGDPLVKTAKGPVEPTIDDPMGAVESFLQRNQKEADDSIKALTQEAEALRARLQKVEAALGRWKGVAQALEQQAKSGVNSTPPVAQDKPVAPGSETSPRISLPGEAPIPPQPASSPTDPPPIQPPGLPGPPTKSVSEVDIPRT
jgi:hypothetical protein